jgi:GDP-L-fucose synthase
VSTFWSDRRILLTGGGGFLGRFLRARLGREHPAELLAPRMSELDLREPAAVARIRGAQTESRHYGAAVVGGIGANRLHPAGSFMTTRSAGIHLIENRGVRA